MKKFALSVLILVLLVGGCVKVPNVKVYANAIVDTKSEVELISADFPTSANRTLLYIYNMTPPTPATDDYKDDKDTAQIWSKSGQLFTELHLILLYYGVALQQLTQDEVINFSNEIDDCTSNINGLLAVKGSTSLDKEFGTGFKSAIDTTSTIVMKWASDAYRRNELVKVFADDGKDIKKFMKGLKSVSVNGYETLLNREAEEANRYFEDMLDNSKTNEVTSILIKERQLQFEADLMSRRATLDSYSKKMDNIIAAHEALMELAWRDNLDVETLVAEVQVLVADIYTIRDKFEAIQ